MRVVGVLALAFEVWLAMQILSRSDANSVFALLVLAVMALATMAVLLVFSRLTFTLEPDRISTRWGLGLPGPVIDLAQVERVGVQRDIPIWWGYGVRSTLRRWVMYRLSGRNAVVLDTLSDKRILIGTDDPEGLERAIEGALKAQKKR
jgi:hypothetical protein